LSSELRLGIHQSTPAFFDALRQNVDLLSLNAFAAPVATIASYSVASRIVATSVVTVNSFNRLLYPTLAVAGQSGSSAVFLLARKYMAFSVAIATLTSIGLFLAAPYLTDIFGGGFGELDSNLRVLCWILIIYAVLSAAYEALGATENHSLRATVYNGVTLVGAALVVVMTFGFGLAGTIVALYVSYILAAGALWMALILRGRSHGETK
jgi:O-antigen/teichoic acid export membrane protein